MGRNSKLYFLITWTLIVLCCEETTAKRKSSLSAPDSYDEAMKELEELIRGVSYEAEEEEKKPKEPEGRTVGKVTERKVITKVTGDETKDTTKEKTKASPPKKIKGRSMSSKGSRVTERVSSFGIYG